MATRPPFGVGSAYPGLEAMLDHERRASEQAQAVALKDMESAKVIITTHGGNRGIMGLARLSESMGHSHPFAPRRSTPSPSPPSPKPSPATVSKLTRRQRHLAIHGTATAIVEMHGELRQAINDGDERHEQSCLRGIDEAENMLKRQVARLGGSAQPA